MKTFSAKPAEVKREWLLIDAEGKTLGRLATPRPHPLTIRPPLPLIRPHHPTIRPHDQVVRGGDDAAPDSLIKVVCASLPKK